MGLSALIVGLLWLGQGLGLVRWPAASAMIGVRPWATRGALLAAAGAACLLLSRRR